MDCLCVLCVIVVRFALVVLSSLCMCVCLLSWHRCVFVLFVRLVVYGCVYVVVVVVFVMFLCVSFCDVVLYCCVLLMCLYMLLSVRVIVCYLNFRM